MDFIPCLKWVRSGLARSEPCKIELTREELVQLISEARPEDSDQEAGDAASQDDGYGMDTYDEEPENYSRSMSLGSVFRTSELAGDSSDTDDEDDKINPDDNLVIVGKGSRQQGYSENLEVHVYNEKKGDMYAHHDIMLPSCPLSLELVTVVGADDSASTLVCVGLMSGKIELHDIDIFNPVKPEAKLGTKKNKGHSEAALDLSWNHDYSHILASSSADKSVLLWDLEQLTASNHFDSFQGNVENIEWDKDSGHILLCSDAAGGVKLLDCRMQDVAKEWSVKGEANIARWSSTDVHHFYIGTSKGRVTCFDNRHSSPIFKLKAHETDVTGICSLPGYNGLLISTCVSGDLNIWDLTTVPRTLALNKSIKTEQLHCLDLNPDSPLTVALGGANKKGSYFSIINLNKKEALKPLLDFRKIQT